ncbi:glycosyltransferase family 39 protein [candidate division WOR-3 bacterium]|nr:glycosyltransferase family 39 protein [candidate division WOR-3 bacterium]
MPETDRCRPVERTNHIWLAVALALTFLARLWFVLGMRGQPFSIIGPQMLDSYYYHRWAIDIISGNFWGSDVFFLRPLYPYLLALVYSVLGQSVLAVQFVQAVLATISCFLLYDTARRSFGKRPAVFASFGFALTGILVFYTGTLLYVETTILLSLLFFWLILIAGRRTWLWIAAGICFGLLVICRPEIFLLLPFLFIWLWSRGNGGRSRLLTMAVAALVVIAVVPLRNYIVARDPVLFTAHSGINFYYGNNPAADGTWQPTAELEKGGGFSHERLAEISRSVEGREVKPSQASAYWTRQGLRFITHQPGLYLRLLGRKLLLSFSNYEVPNDYYPETARAGSLPLRLAFVDFGLVLALGFLGMVWAWPKRGRVLPAYLFVAAYFVSSLLFYVLSRLRAPVVPFLLMFAGYGLSELVDSLRQRRVMRTVVAVVIAVVVYIVSAIIPVDRSSYSAQAWTQTGNIHLEQQDFGKAAAAFQRALVALPSYSYARYSLVLALAGAGQTSDAKAEVRKMEQATAGSNDRKTLLSLAAARIAIANATSTADPAWRPARRLADAWVAISEGKYARAESLYRTSLDQNPDDAESSFLLGMVYARMDSLVQAREWLARAAAMDPANDAARTALKSVGSRLLR